MTAEPLRHRDKKPQCLSPTREYPSVVQNKLACNRHGVVRACGLVLPLPAALFHCFNVSLWADTRLRLGTAYLLHCFIVGEASAGTRNDGWMCSALAIAPTCFNASLLHCFIASLFHCFHCGRSKRRYTQRWMYVLGTCYRPYMLQCFNASMLQCFIVSLLTCSHARVLSGWLTCFTPVHPIAPQTQPAPQMRDPSPLDPSYQSPPAAMHPVGRANHPH
jgi:hypothetical protein